MNRCRNSSSVDIEIGYPVYVWLEIDFIIDMRARLSSYGEHVCKYIVDHRCQRGRCRHDSCNVCYESPCQVQIIRRIIHALMPRMFTIDPGTTFEKTPSSLVHENCTLFRHVREGIYGNSSTWKKH